MVFNLDHSHFDNMNHLNNMNHHIDHSHSNNINHYNDHSHNMNHHNDHHNISNLNHDDRYRAIISEISYGGPSSDDVSSNENILNVISKFKNEYPVYSNKLNDLKILDSNYDSVILKDNSNNTCYLSSRGTDLTPGQSTLVRDLYNDSLIAKGYTPHRSITTEDFLIKQMKLHPECSNWEAVGHSAGGRVVEDIGVNHPEIKVTSFNAGRTLFDNNTIKNIISKHDNITSHKVVNDIISTGISPGTTMYHTLDDPIANLNPLKTHSLNSFTY